MTLPPLRGLSITYQSDDFPAGTIANDVRTLQFTWDELLWAAVTIGRPNQHYVFQHGRASAFEALFRWSMVRMALEQSGPHGYTLRRTDAFKALDPTEKGAVNYFLGMAICKLFAARLLDTPWLLHLDVFRAHLSPQLLGRSRPDLVGEGHGTGGWHAFECKGRASAPGETEKAKAKAQAQRLISVQGTACTLHIGSIAYFHNDVLQFYWRDPPPREGRALDLPEIKDGWRHYYSPIVDVIRNARDRRLISVEVGQFVPIEGLDIAASIHPYVAEYLFKADWAGARAAAKKMKEELAKAGFQPDGLAIRSGPSWRLPFEENQA